MQTTFAIGSSSIKTITRKNFGPGTHLAYSAAGEQRASRWIGPRSSRPTRNTRAFVESDQRRHVSPQPSPTKSIVCLIVPCFRVPAQLRRWQRSPSSRTQRPHPLTNIAAAMSLGSCSDAALTPWSNVMRPNPASAAIASAIRSGRRPMHSHPRRRPCT